MRVDEIELNGVIHMPDHQVAERASLELFRECWGHDPEPGQVPFVVTLPNDYLAWYMFPGDAECFESGDDAGDGVMRN